MAKISDRLQRLNNSLHEETFFAEHPWQFTKVNILDLDEYAHFRTEPIPVRKAYSQIYVAEHLKIDIQSDELIVGNPAMASLDFGTSVVGYLTPAEQDFFLAMGLHEGRLSGHHPPRWETILAKGTILVRRQIKERLSKEQASSVPDGKAIDELRAMLISLDALDKYAERCAKLVESNASNERDVGRKKELSAMAAICRKVPREPAETLWEALQSYWFTYTVIASDGDLVPLGRLDQMFYKFYENDIQSGNLSEGQATELIGCFLIKCNELVSLEPKRIEFSKNFRSYKFDGTSIDEFEKYAKEQYYHEDEPENSEHNKFFGQETNNRMMTAVVGGYDSVGSDATNALSYLILELMRDLRLLFPTFGARISCKTPASFLRLLADVLRHGQGEPIIYNDDAIIEKYGKLGIPKEEICDYSSDGCWEVLIPGRTDFSYCLIMTLQCLEWTMNNGISIKNGEQESIRTGDLSTFEDYESFYQAFLSHMKKQMLDMLVNYTKMQGISALVAPDPLFSAIADDCIEKASDFYDRGARYIFRCFMICGFADTVDSLVVIKKLVFEEKAVTLEELNEALHANFLGYERLRARIMNMLPKYGNCDEYADNVAIRLIDDFSNELRHIRCLSDEFVITGGIATFHMFALWGDRTAASANGRLAYDAIAPNYSPVPGADKGGPLLALASSLKPDLSELMTGTPVDISINANDFKGEDGIRRITSMIKSYCDAGGQIMSITSTSEEELKDAMVHPEKHRSLRIRMGGLSAYFVSLAPEAQRKIIERFHGAGRKSI